MIQMNLLSEQKETHKLRDQNYGCHGVRIFRKFGMDVYRLLYIKCITKKDLSIEQGTLLNVMWQAIWEGS